MFDDERLDAAHAKCVETAKALFGDEAAKYVRDHGLDINDRLHDRFDCYEAALHEVDRKRSGPKAETVRNFHTLALTIARGYANTGIPVSVGPKAADTGRPKTGFDSVPPPPGGYWQKPDVNALVLKILERSA